MTPVALREEPQQEVALKCRREEAVFRIVEGHQGAVRFVPQPSIGVGVKQFDFLAGILQALRRPAIGPATQETCATSCGVLMLRSAEDVLEAAG